MEQKLTYNQLYYKKNRERLIEQSRKYREQNYERFTRARLKYHSSIHGRSQRMFSSAAQRCQANGLEFSITIEWIKSKLEIGYCDLTGLHFQLAGNSQQYRNPYGPSLDRKNPKGGYTLDNCRMILWALNMGFSDWGEDIYRTIAESYLCTRLEYDL